MFDISKKDVRINVLRHYLGRDFELKNVSVENQSKENYFDSVEVTKEESDANIVQSLIAKKLGLNATEIYPVFSEKESKIILRGDLVFDKDVDRSKIVQANEYHNILNLGFIADLSDRVEDKSLNKRQRDYIDKLLFSSMFKKEGERPIDSLFDKKDGMYNYFFEKSGVRDLTKTRIVKLATFDTSLKPSTNYYQLSDLWRVSGVMPATSGIDNNIIKRLNSNMRRSEVKDYKSEFSTIPLRLKGLLKEIKTNERVVDAFGINGIKELADEIGEVSFNQLKKEFESKTGYYIEPEYTLNVNRQLREIAEELK